ncbi:DEAD-box ATP-dependent RNA helicase 5 [Malania oleifera]|uniref:DEAD-box ATP-dependent RNA helicase 5 n=1 Tax=Malania oleifera TaxID=397392 RepID=UPI0025AE54A4|nr:DEAD-box ATP-dependent RNA helicase 5 [Malania oleifera]
MGRKLEEALTVSEPESVGLTNNFQTKTKNKTEEKMGKAKLKRKLEVTELVVESPDNVEPDEEKKKKKKKDKKHNREKKEEGEGDGCVEERASDGGEKGTESPGAIEKTKKKKKKEKGRERESNGCAEEREIENPYGMGGESKKKKEKKEKKEESESNGIREERETDGAAEERECDGEVVVTGKNIKQSKYAALKSFEDTDLSAEVLECCKGFSKPSPIQSHAWPFLLDGRDFIGIAATGSGKTLAFGVPALMHVLGKRKGKASKKVNPLCLVMSPTRELAQQISDVLCDAGRPCGVKTVCLYGGTSKRPQISALKFGVDIVIGTPGRLKDLIEAGICCLKEVSFVVLDEADRMLDMGFEPEVRSILSQTCSDRQMVMFSATWPLPVHQLAQEFMDPNPVKVVVGSEDLAANHDVMQIVEVLDDRSRDERLINLLGKYHKDQRNRVLVFVLYKKEASRVENMLQRRGWKAVSIHGDKAQHARTEALTLFKEGSCPLMIATDVAARGLDIPDVEVVINYSFPLTTEDYVHRIGRTGRAGKKGVAHTFFMQENKGLAGELVNVLREAGQIVPAALLKFGTHVKKKESKLYGAHFREISANAPKAIKITFENSDDD